MMLGCGVETLKWEQGCLVLLDQTRLPTSVEYIECREWQVVAEAIKRLEVRGAPAIGVAAAFALVLGARQSLQEGEDFWENLYAIASELKQTRPTAVNLFWAIDRMMRVAASLSDEDREVIIIALEKEALTIADEDRLVNKKISAHGAVLFDKPEMTVLTHCNAGALATAGYGTALGVIREAWAQKRISGVYADETRPLLQGARLTAWELKQDGIPVTVITDNMAGWVMKLNRVQAVIVGADRVACNGDVANKIGTYSVALLAKAHNIPFYVAAPVSTFDFAIENGDQIPIEERNSREVTAIGGIQSAPSGVEVFNPAFDVTPHDLVTAIITEHGILRAPYECYIKELQKERLLNK